MVFEFKSEIYSFCYITTKITIRKLTIVDEKENILKNPQNLFFSSVYGVLYPMSDENNVISTTR